MLRYRTEIVIPGDRYVCLQLPGHLPKGRAEVTVCFLGAEPGLATSEPETPEPAADREDIEWWEEFEESAGPPE